MPQMTSSLRTSWCDGQEKRSLPSSWTLPRESSKVLATWNFSLFIYVWLFELYGYQTETWTCMQSIMDLTRSSWTGLWLCPRASCPLHQYPFQWDHMCSWNRHLSHLKGRKFSGAVVLQHLQESNKTLELNHPWAMNKWFPESLRSGMDRSSSMKRRHLGLLAEFTKNSDDSKAT